MSILCTVCVTENPDNANTCTVCGSPLNLGETPSSSTSSGLHLPAGTIVRQGQYKIEKTLGQGGFGITYKAIALGKSQELAIKELFPDGSYRQGTSIIWSTNITPKEQQKEINDFKKEAAYLSKCIHPNIARVYDWFEENNTAYMVMDFIQGKSLLDILKNQGMLPIDRAKRYFLQVADALILFHSYNILHRDIKPENLLIDAQDNVILIDFGAAREFLAGKSIEHTKIFTEGYAPLEQYSSRAKRGPSTDIYALCASMYELLTGKLPPSATDRIQQEILTPPRQYNPQIDPVTEQVILTGMRIYAQDRFQSAGDLIDALQGRLLSPIQRRAKELVKQGNLTEAIQTYEKCLASEPTNGEAAVELAIVQMHVNDSQAEIAARKAIQLQPNDGRGYGVLGLVQCRQSRWPEAVKTLQQAASLSPNEIWIQANLAWAFGKSHQWQQAKNASDQAIQLDQQCIFALGVKAWIQFHQKQPKEAMQSATRAIFQSNQDSSPYNQEMKKWIYPYLLVNLNRVSQQPGTLERRLEEFIIQVPDSVFAWGYKGWKKASLQLWHDSLTCFQNILKKENIPEWVFLNYGITQEHLNDLHGAIQTYQFYDQNFYNNSLVAFQLGTLLGKMQQWQDAQKYLERAIQLQPDYAEAYHNLGWTLLNIKTPDGQIESSRKLLVAYRQATTLYIQQGKLDRAQKIKQIFQITGIEL